MVLLYDREGWKDGAMFFLRANEKLRGMRGATLGFYDLLNVFHACT